MSPRRTEFFHQAGNGGHLGPVSLVGFQSGGLSRESAAVPKTRCLVDDGAAHRFGLRQPLSLDDAKRPESVVVESD